MIALLRSCTAAARIMAAGLALGITLPQTLAGQDGLPRFEPGECTFERGDGFDGLTFECGWLILPESRGPGSPRTVRLAVAIQRATEPNGDPPLVVLHGGPGQGLLGTGMHAAIARWPIARERDQIFYDQRDAGLSQPPLCPEQVHLIAAGRLAAQRGFDDCAELLRAQAVDRASYSTPSYAHDLADLRRVLGYERWDIYSASYGSRLAAEAMRRDPHGIRSVVLSRPIPPGPSALERPLNSQRTFARLFAACEADDACGAAFEPQQDLLALFAAFERTPLRVRMGDGIADDSVIDGRRFVAAMQRLLESFASIVRIPLVLHELRQGDRDAALRYVAANRGLRFAGGNFEKPVISNLLVNCYDMFVPDRESRAASLTAHLEEPFRSLEAWGGDCPKWQDRFASEDDRAPVASDIPALVLTGEFDRRAPPEFGRRIVATLPRAHLVDLPATLHSSRPGECELRIILQFLRDPDRQPDTSCVAGMPRLRFVTDPADLLRR